MAAPKSRATTTRTVTTIRRKSPAKAPAMAGFPAGLEPAPLVANLMNHQGFLTVEKVAATFGMSKGQLAETIGLSREALYKLARLEAPKTQSRLKEMLEIVSRVSGWAGGKEQAMAWYRAQPIAAFGGRTAEALVKDGQAGALRDYLDHIALGGFA
jgi:DNA-binding XRE family transcriptional regulator